MYFILKLKVAVMIVVLFGSFYPIFLLADDNERKLEKTESDSTIKSIYTENPKFDKLDDLTAINLGKFEFEKPKGESWGGSVTDFSGLVYDQHNNRVLLFGGGHSTTATDAIYSFDFKTLKWSSLYTPTPMSFYSWENHHKTFWKAGIEGGKYPRPIGRHTYDLLIVTPDREELLLMRIGACLTTTKEGEVRGYLHGMKNGAGGVYDFKTGQWEIVPEKELSVSRDGHAAEYDPISKRVILIRGNSIGIFDPATKKGYSFRLNEVNNLQQGYEGTMIYYPPDDIMYIFSKATKNIWSLKLDRENFKNSKLEEVVTTGTGPSKGSGNGMAYDSKNKIIGGFLGGNKFFLFDPSQKKWSTTEIKGDYLGFTTFYCNTYSPIDNVFLLISGNRGGKPDQQTFAFRYKK